MHEMGIANSILDRARTEVLQHPGAHLLKVGVRIGEWSGVEPESLRFCFDCLVSGAAPPLPVIDIEICPRQNRCPACATVFKLDGYNIECPSCGVTPTQPVSGDELQIAYVEMEEQ